MIENVREVIASARGQKVNVDGMSIKDLLSYVRIDKDTGKEVSYEEANPHNIYFVQRFQLLDDDKMDDFFTQLFGDNIDADEIGQEYRSAYDRYLHDLEIDEESEDDGIVD